MELHTLSAEARTASGKGGARKIRAGGRIPAVVYGGDAAPASLSLDPKDLLRLKNQPLGWNTPLTLAVEGGDDVADVMLAEVQRHPVSGRLLHADFRRITGLVGVRVPVNVSGKAKGLTLGGRVSLSMPEIDLLCAADKIPAVLEIDVTPLDIGDKILLQDLPMPEGCKVASRHNPPIVAVVGKRGGGGDEDEADEDEDAAEEAEE
ncbi:MAG: 50S ribosomal protein L25 [Deltaproteobacteria bacterium]|nr:50S ribosomal protein L25 [Deltaproteobacteria bacterium]